jgi:thiamine biosynthesis lipoprotein
MRKLVYPALVASVIILLSIAYLNSRKPAPERATYSRMLMGTVVEITLPDDGSGEPEKAAGAAFDEIKRLEAIFSSYIPESDVSRVKKNAGLGPTAVAPDVVSVVETALKITKLSGGAFDPTFGPLMAAWDFSGNNNRVPTPEEIRPLLALVDYRGVSTDPSASTVALAREGMDINLGGIAKGYIVGMAAKEIMRRGIKSAIIKAGGDMFVFQPEGSKPFEIGIRHPRMEEKLLGRIRVVNGAVATSGDYERFFMKDNVRFHHIFDPASGFPARRSMATTVVTQDPTLADALSTAVFVLGPEEGMRLVESTDGVEALIVDPEGKITFSTGFKDKVQFIE